jgi:hypothetical protein
MHWSSFQPPGRCRWGYTDAVLPANRAVRLGLRAASRSPELPFAKALLDAFGTLLTLLPPAMALLAIFAPFDLARLAQIVRGLSLAVAGGVLCALLLAFTGSLFFWAGAVPVLAADVEVDRRPPSGNFALLASRGFERVLRSGAVAWALPLLFSVATALAFGAAFPLALLRRSPRLLAGAAFIGAIAILGSALLDILGRLILVRSAAFGEGVSIAFAKATSLLRARLGACVVVALAYGILELIVASAAGLFTGVISSSWLFDATIQFVALAPRAAIALAFGAVFSWLEVGKMASYAALALDAEGLVAPEPEPPPPMALPVAERVVDALPVEDEPG